MPVAALTLSAVSFRVASTGTKFALDGFGPVTVLVLELVAATIVLWILLLRRGYRRPRSWRRVLLLGALEPGLAYLFFSFGLSLTSASNGALLTGLESGFVVVLAAVFLRERVGWPVLVAVVIAVLGMVALEGDGRFDGPGLGDLLIVAGTLCAAAYTIVARRLSPDDDSLTVTTHQFTAAAALVLPLAVVRWRSGAESMPGPEVAPRFWVTVALVGIVGHGCSFLLYNAAIVHIAAGPAGVIINLAPGFGLISAVWWLGEAMTSQRVVGASLIALSVALFIAAERRVSSPGSWVRHGRRFQQQPAEGSTVRGAPAADRRDAADHHDVVGQRGGLDHPR